MLINNSTSLSIFFFFSFEQKTIITMPIIRLNENVFPTSICASTKSAFEIPKAFTAFRKSPDYLTVPSSQSTLQRYLLERCSHEASTSVGHGYIPSHDQSIQRAPSPKFDESNLCAANAVTTHSSHSRKSSRFRPSWMQQFQWLQFDGEKNQMYCVHCRRWANDIPDIRTSFADGNSNFRLEIVNHHDRCKAHKMCLERETKQQQQQQEQQSRLQSVVQHQ